MQPHALATAHRTIQCFEPFIPESSVVCFEQANTTLVVLILRRAPQFSTNSRSDPLHCCIDTTRGLRFSSTATYVKTASVTFAPASTELRCCAYTSTLTVIDVRP